MTNATQTDLDPRLVAASPLRNLLTNSTVLVVLVDIILIIFFTLLSRDHIFWSIPNAEALLRNGSEIVVLAMGVTILMSAGIFDLSIGSNLVLASVSSALVMQSMIAGGQPSGLIMLVGFIVAVAAGMAFGIINGLIITKLKVNSLIATLGTLGIGQGIAYLLTDGQDIRGMPDLLQSGFALLKFGIFPVPMLCAILLSIGAWALLRFTRFGLRTLAIGSNATATYRAGINIHRQTIALCALAGALCGFTGFVDVAKFGSTAIASHALDGLSAITAVVIGGTALSGGRASVIGTLAGAALSIILLSGLIIIRVQPFWQFVATGVVLIAAVAFDQFRATKFERH